MPDQLRVKGHGLFREGRVRDGYLGSAICSCGWRSESLTSDGQRKRAHKQHKLDVLKQAVSESPPPPKG